MQGAQWKQQAYTILLACSAIASHVKAGGAPRSVQSLLPRRDGDCFRKVEPISWLKGFLLTQYVAGSLVRESTIRGEDNRNKTV